MEKTTLLTLIEHASVKNKCKHKWGAVYTEKGVGVMCMSDCGVLLCDGIYNKKTADSIAILANNLTKMRL
jgi:hypothetical protein